MHIPKIVNCWKQEVKKYQVKYDFLNLKLSSNGNLLNLMKYFKDLSRKKVVDAIKTMGDHLKDKIILENRTKL